MQWAARVVTKCRQAVFGAFENRRDRPGDLNLQAATGGKIFKNAVWRKKRACVTTSHFLLSLSVPGVLSLSPFHSLFPSATFSLFHPPPSLYVYTYVRVYLYVHVHACARCVAFSFLYVSLYALLAAKTNRKDAFYRRNRAVISEKSMTTRQAHDFLPFGRATIITVPGAPRNFSVEA